MKQLNKDLCDFIETFQLDDPIKGICFEAQIYFFAENLNMQAVSEVHILTINGKGMDILYILSTTIGIEELPTMFVLGDFDVSFNQQYGLRLNGVSLKWGPYILIVQPDGKECSEPTYQELKAKAFN